MQRPLIIVVMLMVKKVNMIKQLPIITKAIELNPKDLRAYSKLYNLYKNVIKDLGKAKEIKEKALINLDQYAYTLFKPLLDIDDIKEHTKYLEDLLNGYTDEYLERKMGSLGSLGSLGRGM